MVSTATITTLTTTTTIISTTRADYVQLDFDFVSIGRMFDLLPVWMHDELFDLEDRLLRLVDVEVALTNNDPHIG